MRFDGRVGSILGAWAISRLHSESALIITHCEGIRRVETDYDNAPLVCFCHSDQDGHARVSRAHPIPAPLWGTLAVYRSLKIL